MNDITDPLDYTQTDYVIADASGRIQITGNIPRFMIDYQTPPAGGSVVLGKGTFDEHYVKDGEIVQRTINPTTLSGMKLLNVPNPSDVTIGADTKATVTDGEVDLEFTQPGTYSVLVQSWPYLDATFSVTQ